MPFQKAETRILEVLSSGPRSPEDIRGELAEEIDEATIKEAVWRLLDRNELEITRDWKLKAVRLDFA